MAELQFPDVVGSFQRGQAFGTELRQTNEADQRRSRLAELAAQAYGADPDARQGLIQQAVGVDPVAGLQLGTSLQGEDDVREKALLNTARLIDGAPPEMKDAIFQRVRPQIAAYLPNLPPVYSEQVGQGIKAFIASREAGTGSDLKSLRVGGNGNFWAIRGGAFVDTGVPAPPEMQIMQGQGGAFGVNKSTLEARPVMVGGQPAPQPQGMPGGMYQTPGGMVRVGNDMNPEEAATIAADVANGGQSDEYTLPPRDVSPMAGGQLQPAPKVPAVPSGYRQNPDGSLAMIPGGPAQVAADTRADVAAARKAAEDAKRQVKANEAARRQQQAADSAGALIASVDELLQHPGYADLGTEAGDLKINIPIIRNAAKDADAKLKNIAGQIALSTMDKLKTLSASGATGFGSLTAPELKLLTNAIATLQSEDISNAELTKSLNTIKEKMGKVGQWTPPAEAAGGYTVGQVIEQGGRRFRVTDVSDPDDPEVEEID